MKRKWIVRGLIIMAALLLVTVINYKIISRHSVSHWHLPLSGRIIVLDPGHGGPDGGASGADVSEKEVTLAIAKDLRNYLQESGALVLMTRDSDRDLADEGYMGSRKTQDLVRRANFIEKSGADCFVSIHLNAIPSERWRGAQTFYYPKSDNNQKLAKFIQNSIKLQLKNTDRYAKSIGHVYILKKVTPPSALVEVGFLSNPDERELLKTRDYQKKIAVSIYEGIMRYFTNEKVPSD